MGRVSGGNLLAKLHRTVVENQGSTSDSESWRGHQIRSNTNKSRRDAWCSGRRVWFDGSGSKDRLTLRICQTGAGDNKSPKRNLVLAMYGKKKQEPEDSNRKKKNIGK